MSIRARFSARFQATLVAFTRGKGSATIKLTKLAAVLAVVWPTLALGQSLTQVAPSQMAIGAGINVLTHGASGSSQSTTGSISSGSSSLSLTSAIDFGNGEGIRIDGAGATSTLAAPTSNSVTTNGTAGSTTYNYEVAAIDANGGLSTSSASFSTTTGNATLSITNFNTLTIGSVSGAAGYVICKQIGGVFTVIGATTATGAQAFFDFGRTLYLTSIDWLPSTCPTSATNDYFVSTISSGAGTTSLSLGSNAVNTAASGSKVLHDDSAAINAVLATYQNVFAPPGTYLISSPLTPQANSAFTGVPNATVINQSSFAAADITASNFDYLSGFKFNFYPSQQGYLCAPCEFTTFAFSQGLGDGFMVDMQLGDYDNLLHLDANSLNAQSPPPRLFFSDNGQPTVATNATKVDGWNWFNGSLAPLPNYNAVTINSTEQFVMSNFNMNAGPGVATANPFGTGFEIEGNSQGIKITGGDVLGFQTDAREDANESFSPLAVSFENTLFDFCGRFCFLFQNGQWTILSGDHFVGEGFASIFGYDISSTFSGPIIITSDVFNGFNGSGTIVGANSNSSITEFTLMNNQYPNDTTIYSGSQPQTGNNLIQVQGGALPGGTIVGSSSCGSLSGSVGCQAITVNGVSHFIPIY